MDVIQGPGYVIETDSVPDWFPRALESMQAARLAARTIDGFYVEPMYDLWGVLTQAQAAGLKLQGCRAAGAPASWHSEVRAARKGYGRLRNRRAAEWLPTFNTEEVTEVLTSVTPEETLRPTFDPIPGSRRRRGMTPYSIYDGLRI
jgi:hypothetical protein